MGTIARNQKIHALVHRFNYATGEVEQYEK